MNNVISGLALNNKVRVYAVNSSTLIKEITTKLNTSPCASAALGRSLSILSLMGMMNNEDMPIIMRISGDGILGSIHGQYLGNGQIRGYVDNPDVPILINDQNKLDVKGVVGNKGIISIIKKTGLKQDYYGTSEIISGEISEDFTYYFATSEQTPSCVSAGVLVNQKNIVISSGAIIIQLMPDASEEDISFIENNIEKISSISTKLLDNPDILSFVNQVFTDFKVLNNMNISYNCLCSREEMSNKLITLGVATLNEIKVEDKCIEAVCPWCNEKYHFNEEDIDNIVKELTD